MLKSIWKFPIPTDSEGQIKMPADADVLSVASQDGILTVWALVNPQSMQQQWVDFYVIATGHPVPRELTKEHFVGTVLMGMFVWHIFKRVR